jgi:predicted component of type VI protein secretion system
MIGLDWSNLSKPEFVETVKRTVSKLILSFKGKALRVYPLSNGETLIGRGAECHIQIDSLAVSPRHAVVVTDGNRSIITDDGDSEGVFVNGEKIGERELQHGDVIRIGKHTLTYTQATASDEEEIPDQPQTPGAVDAPETAPVGWLQMLAGTHMGRTIRLDRGMVRFGKPGEPSVLITRRSGGYFLSHLEGAEMPRVANQPIGDQSHPLEDGDIIEVGNMKLQFYLENE